MHNETGAKAADAACAEEENADGIDDLLRFIPSSSLDHIVFDLRNCEFGGTAKHDPTDQLISRAFPTLSPKSSSPNSSKALVLSLDLGRPFGGDLLKTCRPSPSSSSLSSSSSLNSPIEAPPLIQLSSSSLSGGLDVTKSSTSDQTFVIKKATTRPPRKDTNKYYTRILEAVLDQSKSVAKAYDDNEAERRGISWRDLLDRNMDIHPLSDDQTKNPPETDVDRTTVVPRLHYLPILLECARVWRHALEEAIQRRDKRGTYERVWDWKRKSKDEKFQAQDLLHPADRRHLSRQAGRIVQRYLCLHEVFSSAMTSGLEAQSWDDFSKSSVTGSAHFLDFVYDEFLRPASKIGWNDLICEDVTDSHLGSMPTRRKGSPTSLAVYSSDSAPSSSTHAKKLQNPSNLLEPVIGALHTIIAKAECDSTNAERALEWSRSSYIKLCNLGEARNAILQAKVASLGRIVIKDRLGDDEVAGSKTHGKTYTLKETENIFQDCVEDWASLAQHRYNTKSMSYRDNLAKELVDIANKVVHQYKRLHQIKTAAPTVDTITRMMNFIYKGFLKPGYYLDLPSLASSTEITGDNSLACLLIESIQILHSTSASPLKVHRIERNLDHSLRIIGICPWTCGLRFKLKSLQGCDSASIDSGEACDLQRSCLALWKKAASEVSDCGQQNGALDGTDEAELIQLAGDLVLEYQRLHKTKAYGIDFFLSSAEESCRVLDFILDNFLCQGSGHSLNLGRKVPIYEPSKFARMGIAEATFNNYEFFEIVVSAINNLIEKGEDMLASKYYDKCCLAGVEDGKYKAYLDAELPCIAGIWPNQ